MRFTDGSRKLCKVVNTSVNNTDHDCIEAVDETGTLHRRNADEVGKIDGSRISSDSAQPYHRTHRVQNETYKASAENFSATTIAKTVPGEISSRSIESLEIEELRRCRFPAAF